MFACIHNNLGEEYIVSMFACIHNNLDEEYIVSMFACIHNNLDEDDRQNCIMYMYCQKIRSTI